MARSSLRLRNSPLARLPGLGLISAATLLAAIGDIARFSDAKHLVGYAGLGARVHDSGRTHHGGRITKAGRKDIRWTMVEAAHHAPRDAHLCQVSTYQGRQALVSRCRPKVRVRTGLYTAPGYCTHTHSGSGSAGYPARAPGYPPVQANLTKIQRSGCVASPNL